MIVSKIRAKIFCGLGRNNVKIEGDLGSILKLGSKLGIKSWVYLRNLKVCHISQLLDHSVFSI